MEKKIIITVVVTGSRPTKKMNPAVPYSSEEIIQAAVASDKVGAAIAHINVRDARTGRPEFNAKLFKAVLDGIRE
jgi:3-keto-5-aminohexanoate cleavage enzyme